MTLLYGLHSTLGYTRLVGWHGWDAADLSCCCLLVTASQPVRSLGIAFRSKKDGEDLRFPFTPYDRLHVVL